MQHDDTYVLRWAAAHSSLIRTRYSYMWPRIWASQFDAVRKGTYTLEELCNIRTSLEKSNFSLPYLDLFIELNRKLDQKRVLPLAWYMLARKGHNPTLSKIMARLTMAETRHLISEIRQLGHAHTVMVGYLLDVAPTGVAVSCEEMQQIDLLLEEVPSPSSP